ncbi:hypothetical protein GCM10027162_39700 [Streptomyces incanus]
MKAGVSGVRRTCRSTDDTGFPVCQLHILAGLGELFLGLVAEKELGVVGLVLLLLIGIWARTRRDGRAVGAALLPALLMVQA